LLVDAGAFDHNLSTMAAALPDGGRIDACEIDPERAAFAQRFFDRSPHGSKITLHLGPAIETIESLEGAFDLVFIDADKENYVNYYEAVLPKLADDGVIVADNVLWSGRVLEEDPGEEGTKAIKSFNEHVISDERVECVMLTVRDGMTLIRHRSR